MKTSCWKHVSLGASNHYEGDVKTLTGSLAGGVDGPEDQDILDRLATDIVPTMPLIGVQKGILSRTITVKIVVENHVLFLDGAEVTHCQRPVIIRAVQWAPETALRISSFSCQLGSS